MDLSQREDKVKRVLHIPKNLLTIINLYPEKQNKFTKFVILFMLFSVGFIEAGQIAFLFSNVTFTEIATACTTVSTNFQVSLEEYYLETNK